VWPKRARPASVTIARAAAGRVAVLAAVAAAADRAAVTEIETEVEIAARVAMIDKQNSSAGLKTGATFLSLLLCYFAFAVPARFFLHDFRQLWPTCGPTSVVGMGWRCGFPRP
jgi:hypothetical protein